MGTALPASYGVFAADDKPVAAEAPLTPINLAGRWTGPQFGFARKRVAHRDEPAAKPNTLTFDIVPCGDDWCGIRVTEETPCGAVALKMSRDPKSGRGNAFNGKLELAKGAAPYVVEAWYAAADGNPGERAGQAHLSFIGDTGTELLMMRRSFPFQADMARTGDPQCTLGKATS